MSTPDDALRSRLVGKPIGQRVTAWRKHRGLSRSSELARLLYGTKPDAHGYAVAANRDSVWRWETGKSKPNRTSVERIAKALAVAPEDIDPDYTTAPVAQRRRVPARFTSRPVFGGIIQHVEISAYLSAEVAAQVIRLAQDNHLEE